MTTRQQAQAEMTRAIERSVALARAVAATLALVLVPLYLSSGGAAVGDTSPTSLGISIALSAAACAYGWAIVVLRLHARVPDLLLRIGTAVLDTTLLALVIVANGGLESPLYVAFFPLVLVTTLRFPSGPGVVLGVAHGLLYAGLVWMTGDVAGHEALVAGRAIAIGLTGLATALLGGSLLDVMKRRLRSEAALREYEERMSKIWDALYEGVAVHERGRFLEANRAFCDLTGYTRQELLSMDVMDIMPPRFHERLRDRIARPIEGQFEDVILRKDGSEIPVELHGRTIPLDGRPVRVLTLADLRDRKRADEAERRSATIVESSSDGIITLDLDGVITSWSPAAAAMYGHSREEAVGRPITMLFPPGTEHEETPLLAAIRRGEVARVDHVERVRKDGTRLWISLSKAPLRDAGGRVVGAVAIQHDMTQLHLAQETLRSSRETLQRLVEASPVAIFAVDGAGQVTTWNAAAERVFGWREDEIRGRAARALGLDPDAVARLRDALASGRVVTGEEGTFHRRDGRRVEIHLSIAPILDAKGAVRGAIGVAEDVTERNRQRREVEASRREMEQSLRLASLGTLVAGVAHEIHNPLSYMTIQAELALEDARDLRAERALDERAARRMDDLARGQEAILDGIRRIAHVTEALRQVARPGTDRREAVDPHALLESTLTVAAPRMSTRTLVERDLRATRRAVGDPSDLAQVLLNLVLNAAEALSPDGGHIRLRTRDEGDRVVVEVEDTGSGIPPHAQPRVFDPFFTTKASGTGLGLSTSRRIVESCGGTLTFTTRPGEGTTFRVELPGAAAATSQDAPAARAGASVRGS